MNYQLLIGRQRIAGGHTDWTPVFTGTSEACFEARNKVSPVLAKDGWKMDRNNRDDTTRWYLKSEDPGQIVITIKEK